MINETIRFTTSKPIDGYIPEDISSGFDVKFYQYEFSCMSSDITFFRIAASENIVPNKWFNELIEDLKKYEEYKHKTELFSSPHTGPVRLNNLVKYVNYGLKWENRLKLT